MQDINKLAEDTLKKNRVAIFIVAYNAERHIENVLRRIPEWIAKLLFEIYVVDDHSTDNTINKLNEIGWPSDFAPLRLFKTPYNQGYGGNQRIGYLYAIENGFDIVVLLHGDGQYAPEVLPHILAPYAQDADAVFGSRFVRPKDARKGGMPFYKWIGNIVLTKIQNMILKSNLSEMHCGYRSYRVSVLKKIPFQYNNLGFSFDADIIIQLLATGRRIVEVSIPTYYGDEVCHVYGMLYAWQCIKTAVKYRLMQVELFYDPKFNFPHDSSRLYTAKHGKTSLHHYIRNLPLKPGSSLLDVGGGDIDVVSKVHADNGVKVTFIDLNTCSSNKNIKQFSIDLDGSWLQQFPIEQYDNVFALDIFEHLKSPEKGVEETFNCMKSGGKLFASTGNVSFISVRLMLLFGLFNYGRRGILDLSHKRLFTTNSFCRLLRYQGFRIEQVIGFGFPLRIIVNRSSLLIDISDSVLAWLAKIWPGLFAYQILVVCVRTDSPRDLLNQVFLESR